VLVDRSIRCCGENARGKLGDGTTLERPVAVRVKGISGAVAVRLGTTHACALLSDGTVRCWGGNGFGILGDGTTVDSRTPVVVKAVSNAVSISTSELASCALLRDGTVRCWGDNGWGSLGNGTTVDSATAVRVQGVTTATSIAAEKWHTCAVLAGGAVRCWGSYVASDSMSLRYFTEPVDIGGYTNATAVAVNYKNLCVLLRTGQVQCMGDNYSGQLGDGNTQPKRFPETVLGISNATAIAVGFASGCARLSDGTVRCWGDNRYGQLGSGTPLAKGEVADPTQQNSPVPVTVNGLNDVISITAGHNHYCALLSNGTAKCWGNNSHGQFGNGTAASSSVPVSALSSSKPTDCPGAWSAIWSTSMRETEVREWFGQRGLVAPDPLPTCLRALPAPGGSALLCARTAIVDDRYAEVFAEVIGDQSGQLKRWLSVPVAASVGSDTSCDGNAGSARPVAKVEVVPSADGRALIVRDTEGTACVESERIGSSTLTPTEEAELREQLCASCGVYRWQAGALLKDASGIVSHESTELPHRTGYLQGPCVDPQAHARAHYPEARQDDRFLGIDIDLDGDGTPDRVVSGGASVWQVTYLLYVQRGDCAYFVGSVPASESPRTLRQKHHGLFDLHTADERRAHGFSYCDTVWHFDGTRYRRVRDTPTTRTPDNIRP
jgi:alpha-tubulin suppressor-like RCC1 family protein